MSTPRTAVPVCDPKGSPRWEVSQDQAVILDDGEFLVEARHAGYRWIARPTGRTRRMFGDVTMTSLERYHIDTVVRDGAIWGVRGERAEGLVYVREDCPKNPLTY